ncbi:MAG TPA: hypothetical protein VHV08_02305 [Pirellulales bacterium]|nr:hypothetical protein [Pirellulales bacterium]
MQVRWNGWRRTCFVALAIGAALSGRTASADDGPILLDTVSQPMAPLPLVSQPSVNAAGTSARRVTRDPLERPDLQNLSPSDSEASDRLWEESREVKRVAPPLAAEDTDRFRDGRPAIQSHQILDPDRMNGDGPAQGRLSSSRIVRRDSNDSPTSSSPADQPKRRLFLGDRFEQIRKSAKAPFSRPKTTATEADSAQQRSWQNWFRSGSRPTETQER